jgi:branched-chain amino acid transport system permease protein
LFVVLGLGSGALIAAFGLGIVLGYRGSGIVSLATGAAGMYTAYIYSAARSEGRWPIPPLPNPLAPVEGVAGWFGLRLSLPDWPTWIDLGSPLGFVPAFLVALATAAVLGLAMHLLVFRPLRDAPALARVVATVGVFLLIQAVVVRRFGTAVRSVDPILPTTPINVLGARVAADRVWVVVIVAVIAALLSAAFKFTRVGRTIRASAENERAARLVGISPDLQAGVTWVLATAIVGAVAILVAPTTSLDPSLLALVVVPALAVALIGRFTSFGVTAIAGLSVGALHSVLAFAQTKSWWPTVNGQPLPGMVPVITFVVILAALIVRGRALPSRGETVVPRLPACPKPRFLGLQLGAVTVAGLAGALFLSFGWREAIVNSLIAAIICLSFVVLTGFVGQVSLGQMAIAGIAGFTLTRLAGHAGLGFPLAPLLASLTATLFGVLTGAAALRVRGVNLAVLTLGLAVAVQEFIFKSPWVGGGLESARVPPPSIFGLRFGPADHFVFGDGDVPTGGFVVFTLLTFVALAYGVAVLRGRRLGRDMLAVRANERAAAAMGIDVGRTKLIAVAISSFIAGIGGCLSGYKLGQVTPETFGVFAGLLIVAFAYLGGITTIGGALFGGTLAAGGISFYVLNTYAGVSNEFALLLGGLGLIVTVILNPEGVAGALRVTTRQLVARRPVEREQPVERASASLVSTSVAGPS